MSFGVQTIAGSDPTQQPGAASTSLRPFANLDLSEDQRTQIRSILQNAKSQGLSQTDVQQQISGVLTPDQQATFQSDVQNAQSARSGHHHHHGGGGHATSTDSDSSSGTTTPTDALGAPLADDSSTTVTEASIQKQIAASNAIQQAQLQSQYGALQES